MIHKDTLKKEGFLKCRSSRGLTYWCREDSPVKISEELLWANLFNLESHGRADVLMYKEDKRRSVSKVEVNGVDLVFKNFKLSTLRDKCKQRRFALSEVYNNLKGERAGLAVPKCYGFFEIRPLRMGPVRYCGVVMECLSDYVLMGDYYDSMENILKASIPVLEMLYVCGVNYADMSPRNLLIHPETKAVVIIDWQYSKPHFPEDDIQLIAQAAQFWNAVNVRRFVEMFPQRELRDRWLCELHKCCGVTMPLELFVRNISRLEGKKIHLASRLSLNCKRLGIERR